MNTTIAEAPGRKDTRQGDIAGAAPPLHAMADLLCWRPASFSPLVFRDAFDRYLEHRVGVVLAQSDPDGFLAQGLELLPESARRRFLRAPLVATLLRRHVGDQFDERLFTRLLIAELAAAGIATELPASLWTARGDRFLEPSMPERWTLPGALLGDTGITVDEASPVPFPDDETGIAATVPHDQRERAIVTGRVLQAVAALRGACVPALLLVTASIEVLALRREPTGATAFHSSTFSGCAGLVRLTNAHLPHVDAAAVVEALVHEAIHCILHVHEEIEEPFVRAAEAAHMKVVSPWTGATIRLQSYVHACAVWYGISWLWSMDGFAAEYGRERVDALRQRARYGFQRRPISVGLAPFRGLLTRSVQELLVDLEERMLSLA